MRTRGFTLVELLIVIGLLGAIALIVIAAINPIEQANRSRDTKYQADSSQVVSAIERYFVAVGEFPWETVTPTLDTDDPYGFANAADEGIGICGASCGSGSPGVLISSDELKTEFANRDFIKNSADTDKRLLVGKDSGSTSSVYACFIPKAKSTRERALSDDQVYSITIGNGSRSAGSCTTAAEDWVANNCYICVPE